MDLEVYIKNLEKKLNVLRNVATEALTELAEIKTMQQAPEKPRQRRNLKDLRVDQYAEAVAAGTWRKPIELRKTKTN